MIALIGFTGAGKTTIGGVLSANYGMVCYDADHLIEQRAGTSIKCLFAEKGESYFRDLEESVIRETVARGGKTVLVTGGGAVLRRATRDMLLRDCFTVHVDTPLPLVIERLSVKTDRPLIAGGDPVVALINLYDARIGLYDFAHLRVDGSDAKRAAEAIVEHYPEAIEGGTVRE